MVNGKGRMQGGFGLGPSGNCVCPKCGTTQIHQQGVPCYQQKCPKCGSPMTREG
jgi:predicted nucleic-acid-binding Zn-ribbon protein